MEYKKEQIGEDLLNLICEFYEKDSKARTFGTDTELYHSEIHMLQCIMEHPGLHISGIACLLGITRGAASQTVKRLERKKMVVKETSPTNCKKIVMHLTSKGETACQNHKKAHEKYCAVILTFLTDASAEQLQFFSGFLSKFKKFLEEE